VLVTNKRWYLCVVPGGDTSDPVRVCKQFSTVTSEPSWRSDICYQRTNAWWAITHWPADWWLVYSINLVLLCFICNSLIIEHGDSQEELVKEWTNLT